MLRVRLALVIIAAAMVAASTVVLARNVSLDDELLASIMFAGGVANAIIAVTLRNGQ